MADIRDGIFGDEKDGVLKHMEMNYNWIDPSTFKQSSEDRAKEIFDELENHPDIMDKFNLLLRQEKLNKLKNKKL